MAFSFNYTCYKYEPLIIDRYFVSFLEQDQVILLQVSTSENELFWLVDTGNS